MNGDAEFEKVFLSLHRAPREPLCVASRAKIEVTTETLYESSSGSFSVLSFS